MNRHPDWLGRDLVAGSLPWSEGVPTSLPGLLDRYTLRDAWWVGLYAEPNRSATLLLRWDAVPPPGAPALRNDPEAWAVLALRFDALERCDVRLRAHFLASVRSGPTNRAADACRTHLVDRHGGEATLIHAPGVRLLCLSPSREPVALPVPAETV
jgi:hypothetical protein